MYSDSPALGRTAAVVRNRRHVLDRLDLKTGGGERLDGRLATRARTLHAHVHARTPSRERLARACSAATVAANGVLFLEPLKPALPDEPHETVLPCVSVIVMVVLLNVALTCATPSASTTFFAFFPVAMCYFVTFFLPAIARRGPFFVRALVCVRWPRTGSPRRWRMPRYEPMSISRLMFIATSVRSAPSTL